MGDRRESGAGTPPAAVGGYARSRLNALRHGLWAKTPVLPFESAEEYETLIERLRAEHRPVGPTEAHLVDELAHVMWRRRRLKWAELAEVNDRMLRWLRNREQWPADPAGGPSKSITDYASYFARFHEADAKQAADAPGRPEPRGRPTMVDYENLAGVDRALDPCVAERFARVEAHLDRKFERTLATLVRLQNLRALDEEAEADAESGSDTQSAEP